MNRIDNMSTVKTFQNAVSQTHQLRPATLISHHEAVERVIQLMHERLHEPLTLLEMSRKAYISPYHFNRIFRQITGIPPNQFLYALRLETAKRLLLMSNTSVTDVCFDVGYNSFGTFIRRFTGLVGLSPSRFRSLARHAMPGLFMPTASPIDLPATPRLASVSGRVTAPAWFDGTTFVGLFTTPIPQGYPIAGAMIGHSGSYHIPRVADGVYYILAAGLSRSEDFREYFLYETTLRGGGQPILIRDGRVEGSTDLLLRLPETFDPPILMTLPLLLSGKPAAAAAHA